MDDMKDEGHDLYPLIGYFVMLSRRACWCGCVHYLGAVPTVMLELEGGARGLLKCFSLLFVPGSPTYPLQQKDLYKFNCATGYLKQSLKSLFLNDLSTLRI